ncbi:hypothetical protein H2201_003373 [Coniosporium apollinis]|uniref:F-box domain-containing protein n=2 Tax=Coniosporium TaxID=2810619 RepID=A0ABQ9NVP2_9PEZI|nr:hypothetical protein H2199_002186 [Cladosporium sp. JES 115]KAJ9666451.1 hypothetical protein H2201_003373 [Coniosporium apollinis]
MGNFSDIPLELCEMVISHLVPEEENRFKPGSKSDLQNANLTCRAFHAWATKYLFRDMVLIIVDIQHVPKLLRFTEEKEDLAKHVQNVQVQIPPGMRWEIGMGDADTVRDSTTERLLSHFGVTGRAGLTEQQQTFCDRYHEALVWPFFKVDWFLLLNHAAAVSKETLKLLPNLEYVEAGICERENLPWPTMTHRFIKKYGADIVNAANPQYEISRIPNVACLSNILMVSVPARVWELRVSGANLSDVREWATINRLLTFSYQLWDFPSRKTKLDKIERFTLDIRGAPGVQRSSRAGVAVSPTDIGSPSMLNYWKQIVWNFPMLKHLRLNGHWSQGADTHAADPTRVHRLPKACLLDLFVPQQAVWPQSIYLHDFIVHQDTLERLLPNYPGGLERLILSSITLKCAADKTWADFVERMADLDCNLQIEVVGPLHIWASANWKVGKPVLVSEEEAKYRPKVLPGESSNKASGSGPGEEESDDDLMREMAADMHAQSDSDMIDSDLE